MALETATYISDLVATNPAASDAKSQGDDHIRLLKSAIKATFPNVSGAVTATHSELASVTIRGLIAGQSWTGTHDYTGSTISVATQSPGDSSTKAASTAFAAALAFSSALPAQTGNAGKFTTTNGTTASFGNPIGLNVTAKTSGYTAAAGDQYPQDTSSAGFTVTLYASPSVGDPPILIRDIAGTFATKNLTLGRNGNKVEGAAEDFIIDINNFSGLLCWSGATYGWVFL